MPDPEVSREECADIAAWYDHDSEATGARLARTCLALYDREDELLRGIATREAKYQAAKAEAARMTEKFRAARAERDALTQEVERLRARLRAIAEWNPYNPGGCGTTTLHRLGYEGPRDAARAALGSAAVPAGAHDAATEREAETDVEDPNAPHLNTKEQGT